jgi:ankyrin repeat protein
MWNRTQLDIFAASQQGKTEVIRALIETDRGRATDRDDDRITPLHMAAVNGRLEACAYLIKQGSEVNAVGGKLHATPLHWAARNGLVETIVLLIQHSANPRLFDAQGFNCLHAAIHSSNYWALLYILCQPDIAVDERDRAGRTVLHWAVYQRNEVSTQILLKMGADPNAMDCDGLTALHWAALAGNKSCITQLLEAGADIRAKTKDHRTAQDIAAEYHNEDIWKFVVEKLGFKHDGTRLRSPLIEVRGRPGVLVP